MCEKVYLELNDTTSGYPRNEVFASIFSRVVEMYPDRIALICNGEQMTYRQLNEKAEAISNYLKENQGASNKLVGVVVDRNFNLFISLLGILKAGGCYLPIDPSYPEERIQYIIENSRIQTLIMDQENFECSIDILNIENFDFDKKYNVAEEPEVCASDVAYVIYTSGSTGSPKGVEISNQAVVNFIYAMEKVYSLNDKKILNVTTVSFDIFVYESLAPLLNGATIILANQDEVHDPNQLINLINTYQIDVIQMTPSRLRLVLDALKGRRLNSLKHILVGGEKFPENLLEELVLISDAKIYNIYGPTEATVWATYKELKLNEPITIGKPLSNYQVFIIDDGKIKDIGETGEICLAGEGLAKGYLYNNELTDQKFTLLSMPDGTKTRIYKTGDLGRINKDGEIECLGRMDNQIKLMGYRIELEEIEKVCEKFSGIKDIAIVAVEVDTTETILVAYYTSAEPIELEELRKYVKKKLPQYMIPQHFIRIDKMPMTPNGKILRSELKKRPITVVNTEFDIEQETEYSDVEYSILGIWKEVLGVSNIGIDQNFFDIGGTSYKLIRVYNRIQELYPDKITVVHLFSHPTVSSIAEMLFSDNKFESVYLSGIRCTDDVFDTKDNDEDQLLVWDITEEISIAFQRIMETLEITLQDILISMLGYCIYETFEEEKFIVQILEGEKFVKLEFDYSEIETIEQLLKEVSSKMKNIFNEHDISIEQISFLGNEDNVLNFVYASENNEFLNRLILFSNIVVRYKESPDGSQIILDYNNQILSNQFVLQLFNTYITSIKVLAESLDEE